MFRSLTVFALSVWLALTSYSVLASSMPSQRLSIQEQSNLKYLVRSVGSQGRGAVDLSDPRAKAAYFDLLARHGITAKTRPYLFEGFKALASQDYRKAEKQCALPDTGEGPQNFRDILAATANADFSEVKAEALDSLVMATAQGSPADTPNFVLDTLDVYDASFDDRLTWAEAEEYVGSDHRAFDPRFNVVHTPWGANATRGPIAVLASFFFRTASGARLPCLISDSGLEHFMPQSMQLNDPRNLKGKPNSDIVICLNRENFGGNYNDCDYGPMMSGGNEVAHVKVVVNGNVTYNDPLAPFASDPLAPAPNPIGYMAVVPKNHGGACLLKLEGAKIASHLVQQDDYTLEFNWGRGIHGEIVKDQAADFGSLCYDIVGNNEQWDFVLDLQTRTLNKSGQPIYRVNTAFITEDPALPPGIPNIVFLPPLVMQFGCIEKGAKVAMKDGSERSIEDVKVGDQVIGEGRTIFNVVKTTKGTDSDFVELTIGANQAALSVTPMHPIAIASRGETNSSGHVTFVPAKKVAVGDRVYLAGVSAAATVSKVERKTFPSAAQVFNLTLEPVDPSGPRDGAFYANGILVGDNAMQGRLVAEAEAAGAALPKREIAGDERIDYENWLRSREPAAGKHSQQSTVN